MLHRDRVLVLNRTPVAVREPAPRLGGHPARPDRAGTAGARAGPGQQHDRGAARPGARVRQPDAHRGRPAGARRARGGGQLHHPDHRGLQPARLRHPGAGRRPHAGRAAAGQVRRGGRAGRVRWCSSEDSGWRRACSATRRTPSWSSATWWPTRSTRWRGPAARWRSRSRTETDGPARAGRRLGSRDHPRPGRGGVPRGVHHQGRPRGAARPRPGPDPAGVLAPGRLGAGAQRGRRRLHRPAAHG